jgi:WhiB family redox-sensing transcriptional regulator
MSDWRQRAACRGVDSTIFFPETTKQERVALDYCASCVVCKECLEYALETPQNTDRWAILGGTTPGDRRKLRRRGRLARYTPVAIRWNAGVERYEAVR